MRYLEVSISVLIHFFNSFIWSVNCTNESCISNFGHKQCFIWRSLVFTFSVFTVSVYKNLKSHHHLLFPAIFPDLEIIQFWSLNYVCKVCKLYIYFEHVWNFGQYLYLSVFSKELKCPTFSFCCLKQ